MIKKQLQILLLGWAIFFGFLIRATPAYLHSFPLNDGGMFFAMVEDLISTNFNLPETSSYNGLGIPYSYPPLAFYLLAFISKYFYFSLLDLFRWTPVILSTLSIVAIYFLAKELTKESLLASISSLSFAMLPATTTWLIMGGGVTRSFGMFFSILTILFTYRIYRNGKWKDVFLTSLFGSLLVLSHPEWTIQTISTIFLFFVGINEKKRNIFMSFIVAFSVLLITMPWWLRIYQSSPSSHFNALQTGLYDLYNLLPPMMLTIGREPYFPIITLTGILGVAYLIMSKKIYWFGFWFLLPFITDPRIAFSVVTIPLSIASGYGLIILSQFFDFLRKLRVENLWVDSVGEHDFNQIWKSSIFRWVMGFFHYIFSLRRIWEYPSEF
uniref:Glycosyltransferase RgtA/B/C/D-like domain-containing protein n=1 Tax=Bellilinea caldifistulae TaxID=360411 RepID=A0A7C4KZY6_9CHLR